MPTRDRRNPPLYLYGLISWVYIVLLLPPPNHLIIKILLVSIINQIKVIAKIQI